MEVELGNQKDENLMIHLKIGIQKDFQSFVDYNIKDVEIVDKLEDKLKLIELILNMHMRQKLIMMIYFHKLDFGIH